MIVIGLLQIFFAVADAVGRIILPALPGEVTTVLTYIFNMIGNGLSFVFLVLVDKSLIVSIATWMLLSVPMLMGVDLAWSILYKLTLRKSHQEGN